ncbi:NAD(P)-dependent alcohol dehydrogenase [Leptospira sp. 2 VSF19]|uniref:NAD(P)-dependent alcohol dehydrogenase n=1 Tax=Leptospira soteropolitanensis TaxID=2950025 RepID=A0AAW5VEJ0_9LEPT|nr:NAD(P)-dependent alcohol dehydrogenase [Leptospira soteropolitanensis]MCW7493599.1 NAD(P)-dependent alcohol dehydrogenase [Leptospira soteropolitanensis]MCW7501198.1 NAD(P)-dependent alcohol dehydrogenase [Leptospira soteropolitanensis]MCW7523616.1 NAD(P)-dependent alcohol dehydrogenase [Leptospira soteropolitanensis]MCW7527311.1 NAD(P)-dependent alcohol dehydrogenase [Leptospira soteropolitanensis]MCW7531168.1 NAD(P)-dependent alcohol dehydrogenase [Leptospira soteropolitanensis]
MKVITARKYGTPDVFRLENWEIPSPNKDEIRIKNHNSAVNSGDWRIRKPDPKVVRLYFGILKPRKPVLGISFAGVVDAIGENVTKFQIGDKVFGSTGMQMGAYAEYICIKESSVMTTLPKEISFSQGAALSFGGLTALDFIQKCKIQKKQSIIIYGASSSVGTAAIQLAKYFGAVVTAVCSPGNFPLVQSLGADSVMDYKGFHADSHKKTYDIVFECVGKSSISSNLNHLTKGGVLVLVGASFKDMLQAAWISISKGINIKFGPISETLENLNTLAELTKNGDFTVVIDKSFPLEALSAAHQYVEAGHKKGNVVIDVIN